MKTTGLHLDSRNTATFSVLSMVSKYRWDAKLVLILAALAVKYGVFLLLAETYATNQLTKSLALIKQLPSIFSRQNALHQRLDKTRVLMQDMVDLTTTIIHIHQLPPHHITPAFTDHVPTAVYWIVRCVLICASHISGASGFKQEYVNKKNIYSYFEAFLSLKKSVLNFFLIYLGCAAKSCRLWKFRRYMRIVKGLGRSMLIC